MNRNIKQFTGSNFRFSGVEISKLGASEYTIVSIAVDMSSSVSRYKSEILSAIKAIVNSCTKSPKSENLLIRLATFNSNVYEEHGFLPLGDIDAASYDRMSDPRGMTALHDATIDAVEAATKYGKDLINQDFDANGIVFVITDGENNSSNSNITDVKNSLDNVMRGETMESFRSVLVGINNGTSIGNYLTDFKDSAGFDQYIDISSASADNLAKLASFVSKSISAQSQALGTGGPSISISW